MDQLIRAYGEYYDLQNAYERGSALSGDLLSNLSSQSLGVLNAAGIYVPQLRKIALGVNIASSAYFLFKAAGSSFESIHTVDELIYGKYLTGAQNTYDLAEFSDPKKINRSNLVCNYFKSSSDIVNGVAPAYWTWAKAAALPMAAPENTYKDYVVLNGRWLEMERGSIAFASMDDPVLMLDTCVKNLELEKEAVAKEHDLKVLSQNIVLTTGNTRLTSSYPIIYYFKRKVPLKSEGDLKYVDMMSIFRP